MPLQPSFFVEVLIPHDPSTPAASDRHGIAPTETERIIRTVKKVLPVGVHAEIIVNRKPLPSAATFSSPNADTVAPTSFLSEPVAGLLLFVVLLFVTVSVFRQRSLPPSSPLSLSADAVSVPDSSQTASFLTESSESITSHPASDEDRFPLTSPDSVAISEPEEKPEPQQAEAPRPRFAYLRRTEPHDLHRLLAGEHPQTVALVLRHLPTKQATDVVSLLPANIQSQVIRRIAEADLSDAEVVEELEQTLKTRFTTKLPAETAAGTISMQSPLHPLTQFEEIVQLSQPNLKRVVEEVEESLWVQALYGASEALRFRVIAVLPPQHARSVRSQLSHSDPLATDVELTRNRIVATVNALGLPDNSQPLRHEFVA